jgi:hypothetical protein
MSNFSNVNQQYQQLLENIIKISFPNIFGKVASKYGHAALL